ALACSSSTSSDGSEGWGRLASFSSTSVYEFLSSPLMLGAVSAAVTVHVGGYRNGDAFIGAGDWRWYGGSGGVSTEAVDWSGAPMHYYNTAGQQCTYVTQDVSGHMELYGTSCSSMADRVCAVDVLDGWQCPPGWAASGDRCYKVTAASAMYDSAASTCSAEAPGARVGDLRHRVDGAVVSGLLSGATTVWLSAERADGYMEWKWLRSSGAVGFTSSADVWDPPCTGPCVRSPGPSPRGCGLGRLEMGQLQVGDSFGVESCSSSLPVLCQVDAVPVDNRPPPPPPPETGGCCSCEPDPEPCCACSGGGNGTEPEPPSTEHVPCSGSEVEYDGSCFKWQSTPMTWSQAAKQCASEGMSLASFHSSQRQAWLTDTLHDGQVDDLGSPMVHVGLSRHTSHASVPAAA
ncbi:MAG: C-type lectin domain-containing protein, partial [Pseudoalteromonas sp.]|nr:C-type lectin domain-containing protein [Pseudoalteromonas sp.]